jgi:oxygen-independent coproporphyrinogen-3 oxidase
MARYCQALMGQMARLAARYGRRRVATVFLGGGTPTLLPGEAVAALLNAARAHFDVAMDAEITMEGNPGTLRTEDVRAYRAAGVNRFSLGAQAAQDGLLCALGRIHRWRDVMAGVALLRGEGFDNVNLDLIFGLPGQTLAQWRETLSQALALRLRHLSCYSLEVEEGTPLARSLAEGRCAPLPDEEKERAMYAAARAMAAEAGLGQYEISNFTEPGWACRHNLIYWRCGEYLGLGCAAHSHMAGERFGAVPDLDVYLEAMDAGEDGVCERARVSAREARFETMMLGLRLTEGVALAAFAARFGQSPWQVWGRALASLTDRGLLAQQGGFLRLTERGMDIQNSVLVELL